MSFKILNTIGEEFAPDAKDLLAACSHTDYKSLTQDELLTSIADYDGIIVGLGLLINKEVIERGQKLKFIATATTGLDHIDVAFAKEKGVEIVSLRNDLEFMNRITGTAELSWGLLLSIVRKIPQAFDSVKRHEWKREDYKGNTLSEKTLGILGLGRLGSHVARYGKAFGMNVIFTDPYVESSSDAKKVSFDELVTASDVLSIHVHLKDDTENVIAGEAIAKMKKNAVIVNTSRGKIVDEDALLNAIREGKIAGYATDVLSGEVDWKEEIPKDHLLVAYAKDHDNVLIVPHIGGMTHESRILTDIRIAEKVSEFVSR